jgi:hypothetical protein
LPTPAKLLDMQGQFLGLAGEEGVALSLRFNIH